MLFHYCLDEYYNLNIKEMQATKQLGGTKAPSQTNMANPNAADS